MLKRFFCFPLKKRVLAQLIGFTCFLLLTSCTHTPTGGDGAEALYKEAEEAFKDDKYIIALEKFREVKNRYPYSPRATDAELRIGDTYFAEESFIEAASSYEVFRELHPTYPKGDYVQYRIGLSYFSQIPDIATRDLSAAHKAIESFEVLLAKYPSSEFVAKAKDAIADCKKKLADYENYVGDFYFARKHYLAASYRYSTILRDYPGANSEEKILFRLGECYFQMKMYENAKATYNRLLQQYPNSTYKGAAQAKLKEIPS